MQYVVHRALGPWHRGAAAGVFGPQTLGVPHCCRVRHARGWGPAQAKETGTAEDSRWPLPSQTEKSVLSPAAAQAEWRPLPVAAESESGGPGTRLVTVARLSHRDGVTPTADRIMMMLPALASCQSLRHGPRHAAGPS